MKRCGAGISCRHAGALALLCGLWLTGAAMAQDAPRITPAAESAAAPPAPQLAPAAGNDDAAPEAAEGAAVPSYTTISGRYDDPAFGFSFAIPDKLPAYSAASESAGHSVRILLGDRRALTISAEDVAHTTTPQASLDQAIQSLKEVDEIPGDPRRSAIALAGMPAERVDLAVHGIPGLVEQRQAMIIALRDHRVRYFIQLETLPETQAQDDITLNAVISSFRLTPRQK